MSEKKSPFTYSKTLAFHVTLTYNSDSLLSRITPEIIAEVIQDRLESKDTDPSVTVRVEQAPCYLSQLICELAKLQHTLDRIKEEVAK